MMLIVGHFCIRGFAGIAKVPKRLLFPAVLVLCFYGCYAISSNMFDVLAMTCIGGLGYLMRCWNIPVAPFLIAYVLGPLLEDNLRRSLLMSNGSYDIFLRSPICWFFWGMFVVALFYIYRQHRRDAARN
jgi:putative tricarboxylic transport membrane protein